MELLPANNVGYGTQTYWEERYAAEDPTLSYDWFKTYSELKELIHEHIPIRDSRIVMLGCGNSSACFLVSYPARTDDIW